ncbi:MAG: nicotinate (nicotinamide) nucleotide adenylyltransferase [Flavobacteriales bacterium]|nr:nicotinate (nicotinamide) nucleotide adenylyltransferase [Flavobacteriales bacterium]
MKAGLLFGSFNPVHNGHLKLAEHILKEMSLDQIWFVVSPSSPFKQDATLLPAEDRITMLRQALKDLPSFRLCDVELGMPRPSYTIDTMKVLTGKFPDYQFFLIMGSDNLEHFDKWKGFDQLREQWPVIVYERPGHPLVKWKGLELHSANGVRMELSSTRIRSKVKAGEPIDDLVPKAVADLILNGGYYKKEG